MKTNSATFTRKMTFDTFHTVHLLFLILSAAGGSGGDLEVPIFSPLDLYRALDTACVVVSVIPAHPHLEATMNSLRNVFAQDEGVIVGTIHDPDLFVWPSGKPLWVQNSAMAGYGSAGGVGTKGGVRRWPELLYFSRRVVDRSCLVRPAHTQGTPVAEQLAGPYSLPALTEFVNGHCSTFRNYEGTLNDAGVHRNDILRNLFRVESMSDTTMGALYSQPSNSFNQSHRWEGAGAGNSFGSDSVGSETGCSYGLDSFYRSRDMHDVCTAKSLVGSMENINEITSNVKLAKKVEAAPAEPARCDILTRLPTAEEFFHKYLKRSKPFIIKNLTSQWDAFDKWTNEYLRHEFGQADVHVKLTPNGDYEGVERADLWEDFRTFQIPETVRKQLKFPDLVTVRPAGLNMNFSKFMDIINKTAQQNEADRTLSAYLEYSSIPDHMPSLEQDVEEPGFLKNLLSRKHFNIWLSDGHTLGRLHFDQFDNLLCQISGRKQLTLFEPHHNAALYEAHIQQATLTYDPATQQFRRQRLEDSTSMVMAPVNLLQPNFKRFPLFTDVRPVSCTLDEGDALYLPAFWWHEVQSYPSTTVHRNLAVNFWYEPFLTREFPCQECTLDVNPFYHNLLSDWVQ